jgi:hypothetical protein
MTLFIPNYIPSMLSHLCPSGCGSASSPAVYTPACITNPIFAFHPHLPPPSLPQSLPQRRHGSNKWLGPCSSMQEHWTYPSSPQSANSPPINLPLLNTTLPLPTASSTMPHPTPTPTKPSTPLPWLSVWACTYASFLSRPKSGSVAGCSIGLGDSPSYLLNLSPEPQKATDKVGKTNSPLSVPPAFYNPTLLM